MKRFLKRLEVLAIVGLVCSGCELEETTQKEKAEKGVTVHTEEKQLEAVQHIPGEEGESIRMLIDSYVQTRNDQNFDQHMALFSSKSLGLEDTKAQKKAEFKKQNKKIELLDLSVEQFEGEHAVVETKEKDEVAQKKVRYSVGKENGIWKVEEVCVVEKK